MTGTEQAHPAPRRSTVVNIAKNAGRRVGSWAIKAATYWADQQYASRKMPELREAPSPGV